MTNSDSFAGLLKQVKTGDQDAVARLWRQFYEPLKQLAGRKLTQRDRRTRDEEDLALSALNAFYKCIEEDRYSSIVDEDDVWRLLVSIVERKTIDHLRYQYAERRGKGQTGGESIFLKRYNALGNAATGISQFPDHALHHEFQVEFLDQLNAILDKLDDPELRLIVNARIAGFTNTQIAEQIGKSVSSVERKMRLTRDIWRKADGE